MAELEEWEAIPWVCPICGVMLPEATAQPQLCETCQELSHFQQQLLLILNRLHAQVDNLVQYIEILLDPGPPDGPDRRP